MTLTHLLTTGVLLGLLFTGATIAWWILEETIDELLDDNSTEDVW